MLFGKKPKPALDPQPPISLVQPDPYRTEETLSEIFKNAQSRVRVFSAQLETRQFGQPKIVEEAGLFLCCKDTSMDILMSAEQHKKYKYHPLIELKKKHPQKVNIRTMDKDMASGCTFEFMIADDKAYFYRSEAGKLGVASPNDPEKVISLNNGFDIVWEKSFEIK